jgi:hypothetical protein
VAARCGHDPSRSNSCRRHHRVCAGGHRATRLRRTAAAHRLCRRRRSWAHRLRLRCLAARPPPPPLDACKPTPAFFAAGWLPAGSTAPQSGRAWAGGASCTGGSHPLGAAARSRLCHPAAAAQPPTIAGSVQPPMPESLRFTAGPSCWLHGATLYPPEPAAVGNGLRFAEIRLSRLKKNTHTHTSDTHARLPTSESGCGRPVGRSQPQIGCVRGAIDRSIDLLLTFFKICLAAHHAIAH